MMPTSENPTSETPDGENSSSENPAFRVDSERLIHGGYVIDLYEVGVTAPDGSKLSRDVIRHPGAVSVVAVEAGAVLLVRQYRVAVDEQLWEIPAGKLDLPGEDPAACAHRELLEETGMTAGELHHLVSAYLSPGYSDELHHIYLATGLTPADGGARPDGAEEHFMVAAPVPLAEVPAMIADGRIRDAKTIMGCLLALRRLAEP